MKKSILFVITAFFLLSSVHAAITDHTPASYYSFDTNADDEVGSYDGTVQNGLAHLTSGCQIGGCYDSNNSNENINFGTSAHKYSTYTILMWVNIDDYSGTYSLFGGDAGGYNDDIICVARTTGSAEIECNYHDAGTSSIWVLEDNPSDATATEWHSIAIATSSGDAEFYIDGVSVDTDTNQWDLSSNTNTFWLFDHSDGARDSQMKIDEFYVYNERLNDTIISDWHTQTSGGWQYGDSSTWSPSIDTDLENESYPYNPNSTCYSGQSLSCEKTVELWNNQTWADVVDDDFGTNGLAAVRWYTTEGTCSGTLCEDQLHSGDGDCPDLSISGNQFCGVTDEGGNVLLSLAMGTSQERYEKLHNFTQLLKHPSIDDLQCWKYYVNGTGTYNSYDDLCVASDSASDASIRILGAYAIACAKQEANHWTNGSVDYCADYEEQGEAIWNHEIIVMSDGNYFLANGHNNALGAPTNADALRPDYYELQYLADYAQWIGNTTRFAGVEDFMRAYNYSTGDGHIHRGKTSHFNATPINRSNWDCDQLCSPYYMDNTDTWRAMPAISNLFNVHPLNYTQWNESLVTYWYENYVHPYDGGDALPFEIYSNGTIKTTEDSYKTLSMWLPLTSAMNHTKAKNFTSRLTDVKYNYADGQFYGSAYYGAYFSQFAQRSVGSISGLMDPDYVKTWYLIEEVVDVTAPTISNIVLSNTSSTITVSWDTTDEAANSTIHYSTGSDEPSTVTDAAYNTTHTLQATGLTNNTQYYVNITSCDAAGNCDTSNGHLQTTAQISSSGFTGSLADYTPASYYSFDTNANDEVGSYDGTVEGTLTHQTSNCQIGGCYNSTAAGDNINYGTSAHKYQYYTMLMWMNLKDFNTASALLGADNSGYNDDLLCVLRNSGGNEIECDYHDAGTSSIWLIEENPTSISGDTWVSVGIMTNSSGAYLYVDGQEVDSDTHNWDLSSNTQIFRLFDHQPSVSQDSFMTLDEFYVYDQALPDTIISDWHTQTSGGAQYTSSSGNRTPTPENLTHVSNSTTEIEVDWDMPNNDASKYLIYLDSSNTQNVTDTNATLTGLTNNTQYDIYVKAYNANYTNPLSNASNTLTVTTQQTVAADTTDPVIHARFPTWDHFWIAQNNTAQFNITSCTDNTAVTGYNWTVNGTLTSEEQNLSYVASDFASGTMEVIGTCYDAEGNSVSTNFTLYNMDDEDFMVIQFPDTQGYTADSLMTDYYLFRNMTDWVKEQYAYANIKLVGHVGDIVHNSVPVEYTEANHTMSSIIDETDVAVSIAIGNHDPDNYYKTDDSIVNWSIYFNETRFSSQPYFGNCYSDRGANCYTYFNASGMRFLSITLDWCPTPAMGAWAQEVIQNNSDKRVLLWTHSYMYKTGNTRTTTGSDHSCQYYINGGNLFRSASESLEGEEIWTNVIKNASTNNTFMVYSGHQLSSTGSHGDAGLGYRTDAADAGQTVHQFLSNYQDYSKNAGDDPDYGDGVLRINWFSPSNDEIYTRTYSTYWDEFQEAGAGENITMSYVMEEEIEDTTAPTISNVVLSNTSTTITVGWDTDEAANSTVDYAAAGGSPSSITDALYNTSHNVLISGLINGTSYYVNITSCDASGNCDTSNGHLEVTNQTAQEYAVPKIFDEQVNDTSVEEGGKVKLLANVTSSLTVSTVKFEVQFPNGTKKNYTAGNIGGVASSSITTQNLSVFIPFNETSGTSAFDSIGYAHNGTLTNGASFSGGRVVLDGINDYVQLSDTTGLDAGDDKEFTFCVVMNATSSSEKKTIWEIDSGATKFDYDTDLYVNVRVGSSGTTKSDYQVTLDEEYHICFKHSNTQQNLSVYENGAIVYSRSSPSGNALPANNFYLGTHVGTEDFAGTFKNMRYYNGYMLTDDEILSVCQQDFPSGCASGASGATNQWEVNFTDTTQEGSYTWTLSYAEDNTSQSNTTTPNLEFNVTATEDTTAPTIENVTITNTSSAITVNWDITEISNASVEYGTTTSLGSTETDARFLSSHSIEITGLTNNTLYYLNITSCDEAGNCGYSGGHTQTTNQTVQVVTGANGLDTCEQDRTCCKDIGLEYVCFRNDKETLVGNEVDVDYIMTNETGVNDFVGNNRMSYKDSLFYTSKTGSLTAGIGFIHIKENTADYLMNPFDVASSGGAYVWTPAVRKTYSGQDWASGFYVESEQGFINKNTIAWRGKANKFNDVTKNLTFDGQVSTSGVAAYDISYREDIDGVYAGFEININKTCSSFCDKQYNFTFLVVFNETPDFYTISSGDFKAYYDFTSLGENKTIHAIWTEKKNESQISDWIESPRVYMNETETLITQDFRDAKRPSYINNSETYLEAYYRNIWGILWASTVQYGDEYGVSNYGDYRALYADPVKYNGVFAGDYPRICLGLLESYNSSRQDIIELCKDQFRIFQANNNSGYFVGSVRDSYIDTGYNHPFSPVVAWKIYQADSNISFLEQMYPALKNNLVRRDDNRKDTNDLYYCSGGECGDGRSLSVAIDMNSEMHLAWKSLSYIANATGENQDSSNFSTKSAFLEGKIYRFWNSTDGYFYDLIKDSYTLDTDPYDKGTGFAWSFAFANITEVVTNSTYAQGMNESVRNSSRYGTTYKVPDIPANSADYTADCGLWWCGNAWSILAWRATIGLHNFGYEDDSNWLRNETLDMISDFHTGKEWYDSDNSGDVNGNEALYGWSMSNFIYLANRNDFTLSGTSATQAETPDTQGPTITVHSPTNQTYSNTEIRVSFSATDDTGVDTMWYDNSTVNITYTQAVITNIDEGEYTFFFYANDTLGYLSVENVTFNVNVSEPQTPPLNYTNLYDSLMEDYRDWDGYNHWSYPNQWYNDNTKVVESLVDMYRATGNVKYLGYADDILGNWTLREDEWIGQSSHFMVGHIAGSMAKFAYYANQSGNTSLESNASFYMEYVNNTVLPVIDGQYDTFTYNGEIMGLLWESNKTRPINQNYGYSIANAYLGELGYTARNVTAHQIIKAIGVAIWTDTCHYDATKTCQLHPYRAQYNVSREVMTGTEYGLYPTTSSADYFTQDIEHFAVLYELGYTNDTYVKQIANTLYYNTYAQEGGTSNVLLWASQGSPGTVYSDFHGYYDTHIYDKMPYYARFEGNLTNVSAAIIEYLEDWVSVDGTYLNYCDADSTCALPYDVITDPISGTYSTIEGDTSNFMSNMVKWVSSHMLAENYDYYIETLPEPEPVPPYIAFDSITNTTGNDSVEVTFTTNGNYTYTEWYQDGSLIVNNSLKTYNYTGLTNSTEYNFTIQINWNATVYNTTELIITTLDNSAASSNDTVSSGGGGGGSVPEETTVNETEVGVNDGALFSEQLERTTVFGGVSLLALAGLFVIVWRKKK